MAQTEKKPRPVPTPSLTTETFWQAANEGRLLLQYDAMAGKYQFWPRPVSIHSGSADMEWHESSGRGTLFAFTTVHVPARGFEDVVPYVLGAVDLTEGVRIVGRLVNVAPGDVSHGMKLRICWERLTEDIQFFTFEPDA